MCFFASGDTSPLLIRFGFGGRMGQHSDGLLVEGRNPRLLLAEDFFGKIYGFPGPNMTHQLGGFWWISNFESSCKKKHKGSLIILPCRLKQIDSIGKLPCTCFTRNEILQLLRVLLDKGKTRSGPHQTFQAIGKTKGW